MGIARKAGFIEAGEETVQTAVSGHKAKLIIIASDIGENSRKKVKTLSKNSGVLCVEVPNTKYELGLAVGRGETGIVALTDVGIAASFAEKLTAEKPEYCNAAAELREKADKHKKAKKEKRNNVNKSKTGKRRMK